MKNDTRVSIEQQEVFKMITKGFMTPKQVAIRRGTSIQAVYKTIRKLRQNSFFSGGFRGGFKKRDPLKDFKPPTNKGQKAQKGIRLHGQEFNCRVLWKSGLYDRLLKTKNIIFHDGNTIRLFLNVIEVYCDKNRSFFGQDEHRATAQSLSYWSKFFGILEQKLGIILIKGFNTNIRQVNAHYAEINNELAEEYNSKKVKISIFGTQDAKLWFKIDNSWQLYEAETLHPEQSKEDMTAIKRFFNDIRDNNPPTVTEIFKLTSNVVRSQQLYAENIQTHIKAIQELGKGVNKLTKLIKYMEAIKNVRNRKEKERKGSKGNPKTKSR